MSLTQRGLKEHFNRYSQGAFGPQIPITSAVGLKKLGFPESMVVLLVEEWLLGGSWLLE